LESRMERVNAPLVLIDSSAWIEAIHPRGREDCRAQVADLIGASLAATCDIVVAEVLRGAASREALDELLEGMGSLERLPLDGTGPFAGELALDLRRQGLALPTTDLLIAATARLHGVALLHRDKHLAVAAEALGLREWPG
jgi:predicted nucleic acid-binding protein